MLTSQFQHVAGRTEKVEELFRSWYVWVENLGSFDFFTPGLNVLATKFLRLADGSVLSQFDQQESEISCTGIDEVLLQ
jgi:hypothetical protein